MLDTHNRLGKTFECDYERTPAGHNRERWVLAGKRAHERAVLTRTVPAVRACIHGRAGAAGDTLGWDLNYDILGLGCDSSFLRVHKMV